jgi:glycosyltransferase involved in cell wall biosynthesis
VDSFAWAGGITEGYKHVFLPNHAPRPDPSAFAGKINPGLLPALRRFRPDAVLLTGYASVYHLQGALSSALLGSQTLYLSDANELPPKTLRGHAKRAFLSLFYPRMDAFVAIGENNRKHYLALGVPETKLFRFPYAVDNADFQAEAARLRPLRGALRQTFGVPEGAFCVDFVGLLSSTKNVAELIRAVSAAPGQFLLNVGSGPERAALEQLAADLLPGRHRFAGFLNYDRVSEGYAAADALALTSLSEKWGLVCNEAMNFGLPVVVSDRVGAAPDLVVAGETGFVYPSGHGAALSRALMEAEELIRRDRAEVARAVAARVKLYSVEAMAQGLFEAMGVKP